MVPEIAVKALPTHCNFAALVSKSVHHMGFTSAMTNFCFDQRHLNLLLFGMVGFFIRSSTVRLATSARSALINSSFSSDAPVQLPSRLRFAPEAGIPPAPLFRGASGSTLPRPRAVTDAPSISVRAEAPASAVLARALLSTLKAFSSQTIRRMGTPLAVVATRGAVDFPPQFLDGNGYAAALHALALALALALPRTLGSTWRVSAHVPPRALRNALAPGGARW